MIRHEFVQEFSAESPYCGALVMRNGGGDTCGSYASDPVHESRYDEYTRFYLRQEPMSGEEDDGIPVVAHLCRDCGVVVVDTAVHDRFHALLDNHFHRLETP